MVVACVALWTSFLIYFADRAVCVFLLVVVVFFFSVLCRWAFLFSSFLTSST